MRRDAGSCGAMRRHYDDAMPRKPRPSAHADERMEGGKPAKWWIDLAPRAHTLANRPLTESEAGELLALTPPAETFAARARRLYIALAQARVYAPSAYWL